jgi:uncharacterized small protein (DUF1192 family)
VLKHQVVLQALVELSEHTAQELAERSAAVGRVAELEARVAELEAQGRRLEAERVKAKKALRMEKRGEESGQCLPSLFLRCFGSDLLLFRARGLHQGQQGAAKAPGGG